MSVQIKRWFGYQMIAGGLILAAFLANDRLLGLGAWGLCLYGCIRLIRYAAPYRGAVIAGGALTVLIVVDRNIPLPTAWMSNLLLLCLMGFTVCVSQGLRCEMRAAGGRGRLETVLGALLLLSHTGALILPMLFDSLPMGMSEKSVLFGNLLLYAAYLGLLLDLLRVQHLLMQREGTAHEK